MAERLKISLQYYRVSIILKTIITSGSLTRSSSTRFGWLGKCFFANDLRQARYFSCITSNVGLLRSVGQRIDQSVTIIIQPWLIRLDKYIIFCWLTFLRHHGYHLEANIFLHFQLKLPKDGDHFCDFLHHISDILPQLVHGNGFAHHRRQTRLQSHQIGCHLKKRRCQQNCPLLSFKFQFESSSFTSCSVACQYLCMTNMQCSRRKIGFLLWLKICTYNL